MATLNEAYTATADLNLWYKMNSGDSLMLSDIPNILPLRWNYFKENWEFIKQSLTPKISRYDNPDFLNDQIKSFSAFIETQRNSSSKINPFSDSAIFHKFYAVFDNIPIGDINLTNEENRIIEVTQLRINAFSKNDFLKIKKTVQDYRDRYTDTIALSDADYNRAYGKSSIPPQINATITDANYLLTLQESIKTVDFLLANLFATQAFVDPFALARANANNPEVDIGQYSSGRLVKINYGEDLQSLANRYLGSADKWIDIAIANGLKAPYVDEVGEKILLLANGSGSQLNISGTDVEGRLNIDKLFINQVKILQSDVEVFPEQRTILNVRQIPVSGEILIELDGESDLDKFKTVDNAYIRVFQPNTVNSSFYVLIPSTDPLPDTRQEETPWFLAKKSESEKRAKVDLAINDSGELTFTTNGDIKLSYGLDNAIQAIKLKMLTELGSLRYHPGFGLVNVTGVKTSDFDNIKKALVNSIVAQVAVDGRYDGIRRIDVQFQEKTAPNAPNVVVVSITVKMAGSNQVIPISFRVSV